MTVPLETYAAKFEKASDGWHFSATEGNLRSWAATTASMVESMVDFTIPPDWLYGDYGSWDSFSARRIAQYKEIQQEACESLRLVEERLAADDYFTTLSRLLSVIARTKAQQEVTPARSRAIR